ncbi:unnamed protein product, partial [Ectocarpus fasciculatus]
MDNPPSAAFVATMGHQVVGVFVANREACGGDEVARLRSLFELEDFIAFDRHRPRNQAVMTALALNPIFAGHCRFALKEVMRLYDKSVIYWCSTPGSDLPKSVPWHMIPVRPRHQMQPRPGDVAPTYTAGGGRKRIDHEPAALYFLSRRFVTEPKVTANRRVVVVGASTTALACLEGLAFTPYLNITSLTLVSPGGIPSAATGAADDAAKRIGSGGGGGGGGGQEVGGDGEGEGEAGDLTAAAAATLSPVDEDAPDADRMARMGLERHVRVVRSRMVHLDRENGAILLPDGSVVPYDVLVLCTGLQDDTSRRLGLWAPGLNPSSPGVPGFISLDSPFLRVDVEKALAKAPPDAGVVVHAVALKALCAVRGLIDMGVAPGRISVVRPLPAGSAPPPPPRMADVAVSAVDDEEKTAPPGSARRGKGVKTSSSTWSLGDEAVDTAAVAAVARAGINDAGERRLEGVRVDSEGGVAAAVFAGKDVDSRGGGDASGRKQRRSKSHEKSEKSGAPKTGAAAAAAGEVTDRSGGGGDNRSTGEEKKEGEEDATGSDFLACGLLLCGDTPNVDPDVFRAANNSGLVYDGRLVVDPTFRTSDPAVLAGGTLTKFSRVHGSGTPRHEKFNSSEV